MNQYNRQPGNKIYPLTERGFQQAKRNDSHQMYNSNHLGGRFSRGRSKLRPTQSNPRRSCKRKMRKSRNNKSGFRVRRKMSRKVSNYQKTRVKLMNLRWETRIKQVFKERGKIVGRTLERMKEMKGTK